MAVIIIIVYYIIYDDISIYIYIVIISPLHDSHSIQGGFCKTYRVRVTSCLWNSMGSINDVDIAYIYIYIQVVFYLNNIWSLSHIPNMLIFSLPICLPVRLDPVEPWTNITGRIGAGDVGAPMCGRERPFWVSWLIHSLEGFWANHDMKSRPKILQLKLVNIISINQFHHFSSSWNAFTNVH